MLDSAAVGALIGAGARAAPEVLKFWDRWLDRSHELAMQDKQLEFERMRVTNGQPMSKPGEMGMVDAGQLQEVFAFQREAWQQQFNTGNPTLNAISVLVRPLTTFVLLLLYIGVKVAMLVAAPSLAAMMQAYDTANDMTLLSGVLMFWFLDRGLFRSGSK